MDATDFIRIRNLDDSDAEVFTGVDGSGSSTTSSGSTVTSTTTATLDVAQVWAAQKTFAATLYDFLDALEPGSNTDAGNVITAYLALLQQTSQLAASVDAITIQAKALDELQVVWDTLNRLPSQEDVDFVKDIDTYATQLETWFSSGLTALYNRDTALDAVAAAKAAVAAAATEAALTTANTDLATAQADLSTAEAQMTANESQLPVDSVPQKLVAILTLARAVMSGNWMLVGVTLIRIVVPLGIDYLAKWIGGKLPGRQPTTQDLQPVVTALKALQYNDEEIDFDAFRVYLRGKVVEH